MPEPACTFPSPDRAPSSPSRGPEPSRGRTGLRRRWAEQLPDPGRGILRRDARWTSGLLVALRDLPQQLEPRGGLPVPRPGDELQLQPLELAIVPSHAMP